MSAFSNTDSATSKPKFPYERQSRDTTQQTTANATTAFTNVIQFTGTGAGVVVGQSVYAANLAINGIGGLFTSNNLVTAVTGNLVTFAANTFGTIPAGATVEFDTIIARPVAKPVEVTYNNDTVLVTATRLANSTVATGDVSLGWVHIQKKVNGGDGATRYLKETLVALASPVASNTNSGNTSFGQMYTGV